MDTLPPEVLSEILLHLPPIDRLESSLTCRRWAEAMTSSQLLHDVWLDIAGFEMEAARSVLVNSRRQYTRVALFRADLSKFDSEFWANIGANLRVLELIYCSWLADVFYAILQKCSKLESLKIGKSVGETSIDDLVPPEGVCQEQLRESLSHLRHLHLDIKLTGDILDLLLGLMPNVTSIYLSSSFDEDSDFLERLPYLLERNRITRTGADFRKMYGSLFNEHVIKFVDGTLGTLEELRIRAVKLMGGVIDAIVRCTKLRILTLDDFIGSSSSDLVKLLSNLPPDLEILELENSSLFEIDDMVLSVKLKKLRTFSAIFPCRYLTHESLCMFAGMSTLFNLDLYGFDVDSGVIQRLGCLKNLRFLALRKCPDSECFKAIYENFRRLTELSLGDVQTLTDADGSKLCGFKELRCLSFFHGYGFTDETFKRGVGSRTMKSLRIFGCSITDDGLRSLASHHNRLEGLTLSTSRNISSAGVLALLRNEPLLKSISTQVPLPPLRSLRVVCPRLRTYYT